MTSRTKKKGVFFLFMSLTFGELKEKKGRGLTLCISLYYIKISHKDNMLTTPPLLPIISKT